MQRVKRSHRKWFSSTASLVRTTNQPIGLILKTIFIGPVAGGDQKIGVRKNPTWMRDGRRDLRSRRQRVSRAKTATGKTRAGKTSSTSGRNSTICHESLYPPMRRANATTGRLWKKIMVLRQIRRNTSDNSSIVELSNIPRSDSKRSDPSLRETDTRVQIANPIPSCGVSESALLLPTSPIAIEDPRTVANNDAADHHGPSLVLAYWARRSRQPRCVQTRKLVSETQKTNL